MSDKSYRIKTNVGGEDNVISVNLKQGIKTLNILSLEIDSEDAYEIQTSDYGVIVGRVLANNAFGIPNVKVSVFIPISEEDENDYIISNEYPFKTPQSRDNNGVKYNLIHQKKNGPGTFPSKNMLLDNNGTIEVYDKYWKYTTVTNESGDYMIFGVPTGTTQVHYDCDLSDIGILSQHPYDFVSKGYDANLFDSMTEFNDKNLSSAVHIISQDVTVFVYPFWGDKNANKIGITRKDIDVNYEFTPSCVFMGSSITDPVGSYIGIDGKPSGNNGKFDALSTSVGDIEIIRYTQDGKIEEVKDNVVGIIDGNGVWCYQIQMNLDRIGTDECGNIIAINDPSRGIPTRARVRFRISLTDTSDINTSSYTAKFLVPCNPPLRYSKYHEPMWMEPYTRDPQINIDNDTWENFYEFGEKTPDCCFRDLYWGKVYSVKQYYPRFHFEYNHRDLMYHDGTNLLQLSNIAKDRPKEDDNPEKTIIITNDGKNLYDFSGYPTRFAFDSSCISSIDVVNGLNTFPYTTLYAGAEEHLGDRTIWWFYYHFSDFSSDYNMTSRGLHFCFENDWVNGCLYFPRVVIQKNNENNYDYFGKLNDDNDKDTPQYPSLYISGRHHWYYNGNDNKFEVKNPNAQFDTYYSLYSIFGILDDYLKSAIFQDQISIFSRVSLFTGILTRKKTMLGESVFYYRCGCREKSSIVSDYYHNVYKRLYTTDIILLGNLEDIYDSLPKLYNNLPATTAIFPPVSTPRSLSEAGMTKHGYGNQILRAKDSKSELIDIFGNNSNEILAENKKGYSNFLHDKDTIDYASELYKDTKRIVEEIPDVNSRNRQMMIKLLRRSSLFFGLKISGVESFLEYDVPTFVNTSRICELDVHNDSACSLSNYNNKIHSINGVIDSLDISTNENRSAFATMNYDIENYIIDKQTGYRQYVTTPLFMNSFEGRLEEYMSELDSKYMSDKADDSYIMFRFGKEDSEWAGPYVQTYTRLLPTTYYDYCNGDLILPKDSFYFYFGLRSGFSAIDLLKDKFIGQRKEVESDVYGIKCYVDPTNFKCDGNIETNTVDITFTNMKTPITYELFYKKSLYDKNVSNKEKLSLSGLTTGVYNIIATDSLNRTYSSYFSILSHSISMSIDTYKSDYDKKGYMVFVSVGQFNVTSVVSADTMMRKVIVSTGNNSDNTYEVKFSTSYENITGTTVVFSDDVESVDVSFKKNGINCVETHTTYVFVANDGPEITLNNVPVEYIKNWKKFDESIQYSNNEPDYVFSDVRYYVWDGINTAHPKQSDRNYSLSGSSYSAQLKCISSMCSSVFGGGLMTLKNNSNNGNYVPLALSPYYSDYPQYFFPFNYWDKNIEPVKAIMETSNIGTVNSQINVPHIVGSNYPVDYSGSTLLKISAYEKYGTNTYINNKTIKKEGCGAGDGIYGVNMFCVKHRQYSALDLPFSGLTISPDIPISGNTYGYYDISSGTSGATNFFGVRTVDKRFDYQFTLKTPLLLPSGYSSFNELEEKPFINGKINFDLYGGFRLNYNYNSYSATCYTYVNGVIEGGPDSASTLYSKSIYQDNDITKKINLNEEKDNIWYSNGNKDIDHVIFKNEGESENNINGINNITLSFVNCSTNFGDGQVKPGNTENIYLSYASGVNIIRNSDTDYDIEYNTTAPSVNIVRNGDTDFDAEYECFATFSGSSMTFRVARDSNWGGLTFTDMATQNNHNGGMYPNWARLCEGDFPYENRNEELAIYRCDPLNDEQFSITSAYTVDFEAVETYLGYNPQYKDPLNDNNSFISAYYKDGNVNVPLDDEKCAECVQFKINDNISETFGSNSFLIIPTRKVYVSNDTTSLKQGVVYNMGYVYYAGSIFVSVNKQKKHAIIRLNTPLRNDNNNNNDIDYNSTSLKNNNGWHTIGNINNYYCDGADLTYIHSRCEFDLTLVNQEMEEAVMYFEIENGLKYKINIDFGNS